MTQSSQAPTAETDEAWMDAPGMRCQATNRDRAGGMRPCSRIPAARVTGTQRSTVDVCSQHARMAADRPRLVREWALALAGRDASGGTPAGPPPPPAAEEVVADVVVEAAAPLSALALIRMMVARAVARCGWPEESQASVLLAVSEAAANAIEHGSAAGGRVRVTVEAAPDRVRIRVADGGRLGSVVPLATPRPPPPHRDRGRGLVIMRRLSQEMSIHSDGNGTVVALEFVDNS